MRQIKLLNLHCKECHMVFKCIEKTDICIYCLSRKMYAYDDYDFDRVVYELLRNYRMDHEFEIQCRRCDKTFKTIGRGLKNYGFECNDCHRKLNPQEYTNMIKFLKKLKEKPDTKEEVKDEFEDI